MQDSRDKLNDALIDIMTIEAEKIRPALAAYKAVIEEQGIRDGFAKEILARNGLNRVLELLDEVKVLTSSIVKGFDRT